jgi:hypothetical protein
MQKSSCLFTESRRKSGQLLGILFLPSTSFTFLCHASPLSTPWCCWQCKCPTQHWHTLKYLNASWWCYLLPQQHYHWSVCKWYLHSLHWVLSHWRLSFGTRTLNRSVLVVVSPCQIAKVISMLEEGAHITLPVLHDNVQTREKLNIMFQQWAVCLLLVLGVAGMSTRNGLPISVFASLIN